MICIICHTGSSKGFFYFLVLGFLFCSPSVLLNEGVPIQHNMQIVPLYFNFVEILHI